MKPTKSPTRKSSKKKPSEKLPIVSDPANGLFLFSDFISPRMSQFICEAIADKWIEGKYINNRPVGLYAIYGNPSSNVFETYIVVRDRYSDIDLNVGKDVIILNGLGDDRRSKTIYAVVKSKCVFVSVGKTFRGSPTPESPDGYYIISPSLSDLESQISPIKPISCTNLKTSTDREKYAIKTFNGFIKPVANV